jgi:Protein of unknown function (DUF4232)
MNTSDVHPETQRAERASRNPRRGRQALRGFGALAVAACAVALASACSSPAPSPPAAATTSQPAATASPSGPALVKAGSASQAAPSNTGTTGPQSAAVPRCTENHLDVSKMAGVRHARYHGHNQYGVILWLTNQSKAPCSLYGYPGLGLEDAGHHLLSSHTHWGSTYFARDPGPRLIVLAPGESATASVSFAGGGPTTPWATYLQVTPPNAYNHLLTTISEPSPGRGELLDHHGPGGVGGDLTATAMAPAPRPRCGC